jgi:hypothetical protein
MIDTVQICFNPNNHLLVTKNKGSYALPDVSSEDLEWFHLADLKTERGPVPDRSGRDRGSGAQRQLL